MAKALTLAVLKKPCSSEIAVYPCVQCKESSYHAANGVDSKSCLSFHRRKSVSIVRTVVPNAALAAAVAAAVYVSGK